ncbi:anti-sigma factor family protein [Cohnella abietis]|uniref:Putative zinc-finger domain-containing protein n=1 Tax=Cohnella abietis TaxID=2507935 RepID=A0A3T1D9W4_9BACL|nr:zf-HC2 domain-containing protein [Cohnella abietis]BBI34768.1 hypothetical protein KCTCHS21_41670 [Cohnella abietis]
MICQEVMELMQRHIDSDLDQQETSLMMDHVGQCPDCAAMLTRLQRLSNELEQLPRVVPKFSLVDAILPELERLHAADSTSDSRLNEDSSNDKPSSARSHRPSRHLFGKISGVVAAGVVAGLLIFSNPSQWISGGSGSHNEAAAPSPFSSVASSSGNEAGLLSDSMSRMKGAEIETNKESASRSMALEQFDDKSTVPDKSSVSKVEPSLTAPQEKDSTDMGKQGLNAKDQFGAILTENPKADIPKADIPKEPSMLMSIPAALSFSPDEKWRAVAVEGAGTYQVYNTADDSQVFNSEAREGKISFLNWNEDSTILYFTFTDANGNQTQWQFDTINVKETSR